MSPGRCALPSGMFSTRADDADGVDLRFTRGQRLHEAGDASGARHVALHVLHAGGALDRDAAGVEAHALADESDRRLAGLAAVPAHHHDAALACGALADAEQRVHAELLHRLEVEHFDRDAGFFQRQRAAGEFFRIEHVGGFVHEVARQQHAAGDRLARRIGFAHGGDVADRDRHATLGRRLLVVFALGLVAVEGVSAQHHAKREVGNQFGFQRAAGQFGEHHAFAGGERQFAHGEPAEFEHVFLLEILGLAGADHDQAGDLQSLRHDQLERGAALAGKAFGLGGARHQTGGGPQRFCGGRSEFERIVAEHDEDARRA